MTLKSPSDDDRRLEIDERCEMGVKARHPRRSCNRTWDRVRGCRWEDRGRRSARRRPLPRYSGSARRFGSPGRPRRVSWISPARLKQRDAVPAALAVPDMPDSPLPSIAALGKGLLRRFQFLQARRCRARRSDEPFQQHGQAGRRSRSHYRSRSSQVGKLAAGAIAPAGQRFRLSALEQHSGIAGIAPDSFAVAAGGGEAGHAESHRRDACSPAASRPCCCNPRGTQALTGDTQASGSLADDQDAWDRPTETGSALREDYEVRDWTQRLGVSEAELREAVDAVGTSPDAVRAYPEESRCVERLRPRRDQRRSSALPARSRPIRAGASNGEGNMEPAAAADALWPRPCRCRARGAAHLEPSGHACCRRCGRLGLG